MARCPFCNEILEDAWLRRMGAALMGKAHGITKARDGETASAAAIKRWTIHDELEAAQEENARLRERLGIVTPMQKKKKKK